MASQITGVMIVYSTVCWGADQRKHQSSASLAFVWGIHQWQVNSPLKMSVKRKLFPFDDVIMKNIAMKSFILSASAGSRTRVDCLEGNHGNRYTTDASYWKWVTGVTFVCKQSACKILVISGDGHTWLYCVRLSGELAGVASTDTY